MIVYAVYILSGTQVSAVPSSLSNLRSSRGWLFLPDQLAGERSTGIFCCTWFCGEFISLLNGTGGAIHTVITLCVVGYDAFFGDLEPM